MSRIWKSWQKRLREIQKKKIDYFISLRYSSSLLIEGIAQLGARKKQPVNVVFFFSGEVCLSNKGSNSD